MKSSPLASALRRGVLLLALLGTAAKAEFTNLNLGPINSPNNYNSYAMDQLDDGRLVYGTQNAIYGQAVFGSTAFSQVDTGGKFYDPSSVKVFSNTLGAIGGYNTIYTFNPALVTNTATAIPGVSLQNYSFTFRDSSSLYVGGANGTEMNSTPAPFTSPKHAISYVTTSGTVKLLIDNISEFSGDFTNDAAGNLYVTNNDDGTVYRFDKTTQIDQVIAGNRGVLHLSDGQLLGTLNDTSSIALDAQGRIWYSGFLRAGFSMFDPATGQTLTFTPAGANKNYIVSTFTRNGAEYISYFDTATSSPGATITYGYDLVSNVPEPAACSLLLVGGLLALYRRARS